jgi:tetratricopeptide (TPR) repeat protein
MIGSISPAEEAQLMQTIEMFEVITQSQPADYQSLEILKEAYLKLGRQKDVINTSKRIAQAYMSLGQFSSAILEYETILQRYPDDPDVLAAIAEIESKANSLTAGGPVNDGDTVIRSSGSTTQSRKGDSKKQVTPDEIDDGRQAMQKVFVDGKHISLADFNLSWPAPPLNEPPGRVIEPFLQVLHEKGSLPVEKSLRLIADKTRIGFLPMERYDIDLENARTFPKDVCQRWCLLPFDRMSKSVLVATANPFNKYAAEELQASTPNRIIWYLAPPGDLVKVVKRVFR